MSALLGIGAAHVDRIGRVDGAFRQGASNPGRMREWVGGCIGNVLRVVVGQGAGDVGLLSARGGDAPGHAVEQMLAEHRITDHSAVFLDRATASYTAILDSVGEVQAALADMEVYETGLARHLRRSEARAQMSAAARIVVDANLPESAIGMVVEAAQRAVIALAVSPAKCVRLAPWLDRVDLLIMDGRELAALATRLDPTIEATAETQLACLARAGLGRAVVTGGAGPVLVMAEDRLWSVPVPPLADTVRDVTGAGDALAGVVVAHAQRRGLVDAVRLGIAAAGVTACHDGPFAPQLAACDLDAMIDAHATVSDLGPV